MKLILILKLSSSFTLRGGRLLCADPQERWVVHLMKRLDKRDRHVHAKLKTVGDFSSACIVKLSIYSNHVRPYLISNTMSLKISLQFPTHVLVFHIPICSSPTALQKLKGHRPAAAAPGRLSSAKSYCWATHGSIKVSWCLSGRRSRWLVMEIS